MPTPRRRARAVGSRLFGVYALASLVPVLVLGVVLVDTERAAGLDRGLAQGRAQADVIEQMAVSPALGSASLDHGIAAQHVQRLRTATDLAIFSGSISRLRLRTFSGRVVFCDDGMMTSALPPSAHAFRAAAAGHTDVAVVDDRAISGGPTIRVLKPVVPNATGQAVGVLELYLPYAPIARGVQAQLHTTYLQLGLGLTALYLVLGGVCWSTTRRLRQHAADREHQATHDPLTGLPNREHFRTLAEEAVRAAGADEPGALVLVDLDRFKQVNDSLGHHAGDELLQVVASRLAGALRTDDVVARLGGDEFGLLLPRAGGRRQLVDLLTRVRDRLVTDIELDGVTLNVEASFGVVLYPEHGDGVEHLLRAADVAMYRGKRSTGGIVVFDAEVRHEALDADGLALQSELRRALDRRELVLHYQPKLDLASSRVTVVEALLRWQHPERGLLGPHLFLPAAEQSGLIERLTAWVLEQALADRAVWTAQGRRWAVAVNVSARNLESPALVGHVARLLRTTGTPPEQLYLEVTETAIAGDPVVALATVQALAALGVRISLDDFGVGYTSLSQLRSLPIAELKIDRAFVTDLPAPESDRAIVAAVVQLAHGLGCTVTAEGVETAEAAQWLRAAGCDSAQGYHFARPAPWTELRDADDAPPALPSLPALPRPTVPTEELAAP